MVAENNKYIRRYGNSKDFDLQQDFSEALLGIPKNLMYLWPFTDAQNVDLDPAGRLFERLARKYYQFYLKFIGNFNPYSPRKKDFGLHLYLMDLDSENYIDPFIDETDQIIQECLNPFLRNFEDPEKRQPFYEKLLKDLQKTKESLLNTKVPYDGFGHKSLKAERLKGMLQYLDIIKTKATLLNSTSASALEKGEAYKILVGYSNDQQMRKTGKRRVYKEGVWVEEEAPTEFLRRLKRQFDARYVQPHVRKLSTREASHTVDNAENYFILTATAGFDSDGNPISMEKKQLEYAREFAQNIANMYRSGREHDALRAIQLCKYREGRKSINIIPSGFRDVLRDELKGDFANEGLDISKDKHYSYFDTKLANIVNGRDHSPLADGPRDVQDKVTQIIFPYIAGRMYPGFRANAKNKYGENARSYIATPFAADFFQKPLLRFKQRILAHFIGVVVPMEELKRKPRTPVETECGTGIKINHFWWRAKSEEAPYKDHNGFIARSPIWFKTPIQIALLPVYLPYKLAWGNKWGRRITITTGLVTGGTALAVFTPLPLMALTSAAALAATPLGMTGLGIAGTALGYPLCKSIKDTYDAFKLGDDWHCQKVDSKGKKTPFTLRDVMGVNEQGEALHNNTEEHLDPSTYTSRQTDYETIFTSTFNRENEWSNGAASFNPETTQTAATTNTPPPTEVKAFDELTPEQQELVLEELQKPEFLPY